MEKIRRYTSKFLCCCTPCVYPERVLIKKQSENLEYQSTTKNGLNLQSFYIFTVVERPTLQDMIPGSIPSLIIFEF
jgi:hypothetical protein